MVLISKTRIRMFASHLENTTEVTYQIHHAKIRREKIPLHHLFNQFKMKQNLSILYYFSMYESTVFCPNFSLRILILQDCEPSFILFFFYHCEEHNQNFVK